MPEIRYVVKGRIAKDAENLPHHKAGDPVWLSWTNEGGGWHQWDNAEASAKLFKTEEDALAASKGCPGPWFNMPAKDSIEVLKGYYTPPQPGKFQLV